MKIAVIGGGASGIAAAIYAKRNNAKNSVTVFERGDRILKKLLATGNGRCNLSNESISSQNYFSHTPDAVEQILSAFPENEERQFFASLGILLCSESGRIYPYSRRANAVSDALRFECEKLGIKIRTNAFIDTISKKDDFFNIKGEQFNSVIISCGGMSSPSFGTDGNSFKLLRTLGHSVSPTCYALSPVKVKENVKSLKGIRVHCTVTLYDGNTAVKQEHGELQLTDYGLSGIAIMQLSRLCTKESSIKVDLMPDFSKEELSEFLIERTNNLSHLKAEDFLTGFLHKALGQYVLGRCGISASLPASKLGKKEILLLAKELKELSFTVDYVIGKEQSQATSGGAVLTEFNPKTLESKKHRGLYCIGEALDCVGDCGGYNLHWAWATAYIAGKAVSK